MHTQTSTLNVKLTFIVGTLPPPFLQEGGVEPPTKFSKRGFDRTSIFRGGGGGDTPVPTMTFVVVCVEMPDVRVMTKMSKTIISIKTIKKTFIIV